VPEVSEYHVMSLSNLKSIGWALRICSVFRTNPYKWDTINRRIKMSESNQFHLSSVSSYDYLCNRNISTFNHLIYFSSSTSFESSSSSCRELSITATDSRSESQQQHHHIPLPLPFPLIWRIYYT